MTERIRVLLDEAVAGIDPVVADPVAGIVRRSRRQRRMQVVSAVAAVVVLAAGGTFVARQTTEAAPPPGVADATATKPYVDGDTLVAGPVRLPIPAGWTVVDATVKHKCGDLGNAILIGASTKTSCGDFSPIEFSALQPGYGVPGSLAGSMDQKPPLITAPVPVTLPGGEPGWLKSGYDDETNVAGRFPEGNYWNILVLPWSKQLVQLRMNGTRQQALVATMSTEPTAAGTLTVPAKVTWASLTLTNPAPDTKPVEDQRTSDPEKITAVLKLLRDQTTVVPNADACANPGQRTLRVQLRNGDESISTVMITLGGKCQEAVSSDGGRVRLSDDTVKDLKKLFGMGAK